MRSMGSVLRNTLPGVLAAAVLAGATACTTGVAAPPPTATETPVPPKLVMAEADGVDDRFLVELPPDTPSTHVKDLAERYVAKHGGKLGWLYEHATRGFAVGELPAAAARALADEPGVVRVEQDVYGHLDSTQTGAPEHLDRIDQRTRQLDGKFSDDGATAVPTVYVLDSGLNTRHVEFGGRASVAHIFAPPDPDAPPGDHPYGADCNGHGTHVAGIAGGATRGVAKTAKIVAIKVTMGCTVPRTRAGDLAKALDFIVADPAPRSVVSISIGLSPTMADTGTLKTSLENATLSGIPVIVSAGNKSADACQQTPALISAAFTVGATRSDSDARLPASNFGTCVDLFAPGEDIESASHLSNTGFVRKTGTSMSTPMVAGAAALLRARMSARTPVAELLTALRKTATFDAVTDSKTPAAQSGLLHVGGFYRGTGLRIPDTGVATTSRITITNQGDPTLPSSITVSLRASHPVRGQLQVDLFTPAGNRVRLQSPSGDQGDILELTIRVPSSGLPANGVWTLSVTDTVGGTEGSLDGWSIQV